MAMRVAVMGGGPGGYVAAVRAAEMGGEVTLIERDGIGGTCLNRGCIPSKILITAAELLDKCRRASDFGLRLEGSVVPDMQRLMARKAKVIEDQARGILQLLDRHKIACLRGSGTIAGPGRTAVELAVGGSVEVPWDGLIVATGSEPLSFPAFPFDGEKILSSDHALSLTEVPSSIVIVGGGVIGCELAFLLSSLGSRVTVVEALDRMLPLPSVDEACSKVIEREMKKRKIKFMVKRAVESVDPSGGGLRVTVGPSPLMPGSGARDQERQAIEVEKMLVCVGRKPGTSGIGLETLGVRRDPKGWILADERMETNVSGVLAIGDVLGPSKIMLAHVASAEGRIAAENVMGGRRAMDYTVVPGAIFTMPEVAGVGLTEAQARERCGAVRAVSILFRNLGKAQVIGEIAGEAKIVSDAETGRVLGVHMVGPHATDLIAEGTLAVKLGATVRDLAETIHAHPTLAEAMLEAALKGAYS